MGFFVFCFFFNLFQQLFLILSWTFIISNLPMKRGWENIIPSGPYSNPPYRHPDILPNIRHVTRSKYQLISWFYLNISPMYCCVVLLLYYNQKQERKKRNMPQSIRYHVSLITWLSSDCVKGIVWLNNTRQATWLDLSFEGVGMCVPGWVLVAQVLTGAVNFVDLLRSACCVP